MGALLRCSNCGSDNAEASVFCDECSAPLPAKCPSCEKPNRPAAKFCNGCGTALRGAPPDPRYLGPTPELAPPLEGPAERRHLSILFCDLVGSTEMSSQLDPEDWRALVTSYYEAATEAVVRFEGHVAQYLGDGLLVYFGYPEAHEDDPQRAVLAGLAILDAVAALNPRSPGERRPKLAARIGIDTGSVVVGESLERGADVFGQVANVAARVQAAAAPDTVLITGAVHQLVSSLFVVQDCGPQSLKGVAAAVRLFRVLGPSGVRRGLSAAEGRGLTPFIGRERELGILLGHWKQVCEGDGQMLLVLGEAGIGKSRLVRRFRTRRIDGSIARRQRCTGTPRFSRSWTCCSMHLARVPIRAPRSARPRSRRRCATADWIRPRRSRLSRRF